MATLAAIGNLILSGLIDYVIYLLTDLFIRRKLVRARTDHERRQIWRTMSLFLLSISVMVAYYHHTPYFLWALIAMTFLLTIPLRYHDYWTSLLYRLRRTIDRPFFRRFRGGGGDGTIERRYENGPRGFDRPEFRGEDVRYEAYSPPSPRSFDASLSEFSPVPRRALHTDRSSGYGESELSPSTSSEFAGTTPIRRGGQFATSTPLASWYSRRQQSPR